MSWRAITTSDVTLTPQEQATMNNIAGSTSACATILTNVVGEFIEAIQQGGNQFTQDGSVPDSVRLHVINRTRWLWLCEYPQMKSFQTEIRSKLNDDAMKFMLTVASGSPKIAPPPIPANYEPIITQPSTGPVKLRAFRWQDEDGI